MFFVVLAFIVIGILIVIMKADLGAKKSNESIVRGIAKNIFSDRQDITDYILEGKYKLNPIDNDINYAKVIYVNGRQQVLVNLCNVGVVYNPNVETVLETRQKCIPMCYLFKYQEEGNTNWNELYIILVPFDSVRGVIKG